MQGVTATGCPAGDQGDNDLGHGTDEALHLQDVQAARACRVDAFCGLAAGVVVAVAAADALVTAGAEGPAAVLGGGAVAGEQYGAHVRGHAGVVEGAVELVHGVRAECVAHLGAVEGDAHGRQIAQNLAVFVALNLAVVGDVGEVLEALNDAPVGGVEDVRDLFGKLCSHSPYFTVPAVRLVEAGERSTLGIIFQ